ncbi:MAG: AIPR family protein [Candidatus Delongbacteria bacterium]|nr:AIPR family protein [Candidatus Delongbacteria bacterium]
MAKNDKILIDGIIDERITSQLPSNKRDEAFEYFTFEQILKDYDLSTDEINSGSIDGRNDGGIDGFFIIINGHLLTDPESFNWPKSGIVLEVWLITCKHHDTFKQAPLDNLAASIMELFDFTIDNENLKGDYSDKIKRQRENLKYAYRKVSPRLSKFNINFCYSSRGDTEVLGDSIVSRSKQILQITNSLFNSCSSSFYFYGSTELIELFRKAPNFTLEIPFVKDLSSGQTYILLVPLKDYFNFIQDGGKLRRYLFDSNVRDFMGLNSVNDDIRETLLNGESPDFWWLNNGVTILATGAQIIGQVIQIQDIQIVNGLQTSESIFRHFENGGDDSKNRSILVKVIVSKDNKVRDSIIRATNNQTSVEQSSLHATDKIQRDIEEILKQKDFFYERRTNFYKNQGVPSNRIISPLYLATGFVSLILKAPDQASRLRAKFMRIESSYENVFSPNTDLLVWPQIAFILKNSDSFLEAIRPTGIGSSEYFLKSKRHILSFITLSRLFKSFNFSVNDLVKFDLSKFTNAELSISWELISELNIDLSNRKKVKRSSLITLCQGAHEKWDIEGIGRFKVQSLLLEENNIPIESENANTKNESITMEFALKVNELLPPQPWKPGIDKEIVEKLNCPRSDYFNAVKLLIDEGLRNRQKDGVVYDEDGNVIAFDKERVDCETLKLK